MTYSNEGTIRYCQKFYILRGKEHDATHKGKVPRAKSILTWEGPSIKIVSQPFLCSE